MSDDFIRPDTAQFLAFLNSVPGPKLGELPAADARLQYRTMGALADAPVGTLAVIRDLIIPGPAGDIPARLFDARALRPPGPAILFFHGGGWTIGDLDTHAPFCAEAARVLDHPVIAIDYRLAPEHPFPAAPDDCEAAARWIADNPAALGIRATALVLAGDSAGGNLAIVTAMALRDRPAACPVIVHFPIYPATDLSRVYPSFKDHGEGKLLTSMVMDWFTASYAADPSDPRASPLLADVAGMPPALVLTASLDPIRDQGRAYAAALAQAGVPVVFREAKGTIHGFICLSRGIPSAAGDIAGVLAALKSLIVEAEADQVLASVPGID